MDSVRRGGTNERGAILPFIGAVGIALGILVLFLSQNFHTNSNQMVYFNNMNRTYRLAESGLAIALGQLSVNPSTGVLLGPVLEGGYYENYVEAISTPILGGFYIVTTASVTENGKTYACALHTYAKVANIGEYFAALKNEFILSPGMDARGGKIYAPNLLFYTSSSPSTSSTRAESVDYVYSAVARVDGLSDFEDSGGWPTEPVLPSGTIIPDEICLGTHQDPLTPNYCQDDSGFWVLPKQLNTPIQFPSLNSADFIRYKTLAGPHTPEGTAPPDFTAWRYIYPPGYEGPPGMNPDPYLGHNGAPGSNVQHVFYSDTDIKIGSPLPGGTTIYGQVLFVTPGNIEIHGDLISVREHYLPGAGHISSSTAHQAVLVAGGDIIIKTNGVGLSNAHSRRRIEAFFFCPNGSLVIEDTGDVAESLERNFQFKGAWILGQTAEPRNNIPTQFTGSRSYEYMTTLKTHPPPYLPALSEIYWSLEDIISSPGVF